MADKPGIPVAYLRRLREEHLALYDANVNGWLDHAPGRRLLVRTLRGEDGDGIARAVLSERYRFVDNLDVLLAVLDGIRSAGADVEVRRCDLTEHRMYVQIAWTPSPLGRRSRRPSRRHHAAGAHCGDSAGKLVAGAQSHRTSEPSPRPGLWVRRAAIDPALL
jgi:hypothetical protein